MLFDFFMFPLPVLFCSVYFFDYALINVKLDGTIPCKICMYFKISRPKTSADFISAQNSKDLNEIEHSKI